MKPANITMQTKHLINCPNCGHADSGVDHLMGQEGDRTFGPWYCGACGTAYEGVVKNGKDVLIKVSEGRRLDDTLVLLQLPPQKESVYLVVKGMMFDGELNEDGKRYHYDQHTCPTNYLKDSVALIIGNDDDPHGLFRFVRAIPMKDAVMQQHNEDEVDSLATFPEVLTGGVIDGEIVEKKPFKLLDKGVSIKQLVKPEQ